MKEYSQIITKSHRPTIDEEKRKNLLDFIEEDIMRKKNAKKVFKQVIDEETNEMRYEAVYEEIVKKDSQTEGNRFFAESKKMIKKKQQSEEPEEPEEEKKVAKTPPPVKMKLLGASEDEKEEKSLWNIRAKQLAEMARSNIVDAEKFELVKRNIENLDGKAASKEVVLKHGNMSIH